jgi:coatomer protein complex subunit epsilon
VADIPAVDAIALTIQIHLEQDRNDLAFKQLMSIKSWAQDSLLVNLAESWLGLRMGGKKYQQAFYVYEELAQAESTSASFSLVSQAVAELHLGRLEEAEAALTQAIEKEPGNANALANMIVLCILSGREKSTYEE